MQGSPLPRGGGSLPACQTPVAPAAPSAQGAPAPTFDGSETAGGAGLPRLALSGSHRKLCAPCCTLGPCHAPSADRSARQAKSAAPRLLYACRRLLASAHRRLWRAHRRVPDDRQPLRASAAAAWCHDPFLRFPGRPFPPMSRPSTSVCIRLRSKQQRLSCLVSRALSSTGRQGGDFTACEVVVLQQERRT